MPFPENFADTYELQIVGVSFDPEKPGFKERAKELKEEYTLKCELVGTSNPDFEDKPYVVYIFGLRNSLNDNSMSYKKDGKVVLTYPGLVLNALGYDKDLVTKTKFNQIDFEALDGLFLKGAVRPNDTETYLVCKPGNLQPVKNPEHIKVNQSRKDDVFKSKVTQ